MKGGEINIAFLKVGVITHYYDKIGVGVMSLSAGTLNIGDEVKIVDKDNEYKQKVTSLQVEHQKVQSIKKGDDAGIKLDQAVKPGAEVYKENS